MRRVFYQACCGVDMLGDAGGAATQVPWPCQPGVWPTAISHRDLGDIVVTALNAGGMLCLFAIAAQCVQRGSRRTRRC
jgi:hypothetical protein